MCSKCPAHGQEKCLFIQALHKLAKFAPQQNIYNTDFNRNNNAGFIIHSDNSLQFEYILK